MDVERKQHYAVVIPAFNEEITIYTVARQALEHLKTVIVIDDGSTDRTAQGLTGVAGHRTSK